MSSVLRSISQIEAPVKFFRHNAARGVGSGHYATPDQMNEFLTGEDVIRVEASSTGINTVVISNANPDSNSGADSLVRDLGRRVTIANTAAGNSHREIWAEVQAVNGAGSEGVPDASPDYGTYWIRIYDASRNVNWVRVG